MKKFFSCFFYLKKLKNLFYHIFFTIKFYEKSKLYLDRDLFEKSYAIYEIYKT